MFCVSKGAESFKYYMHDEIILELHHYCIIITCIEAICKEIKCVSITLPLDLFNVENKKSLPCSCTLSMKT